MGSFRGVLGEDRVGIVRLSGAGVDGATADGGGVVAALLAIFADFLVDFFAVKSATVPLDRPLLFSPSVPLKPPFACGDILLEDVRAAAVFIFILPRQKEGRKFGGLFSSSFFLLVRAERNDAKNRFLVVKNEQRRGGQRRLQALAPDVLLPRKTKE